jgi:thiol-disulfide isomerase/thioredoxin
MVVMMRGEKISFRQAAGFLRKNRIPVLTGILGLSFASSAGDFLYALGLFRNANPFLTVPDPMHIIGWGAFLAAVLLPIGSFIVWGVSRKSKRLSGVLLAALIVTGGLGIGDRIVFGAYAEKNNAVSLLGTVENINFAEITLNTLGNYLKSPSEREVLLYIGRTDCAACERFEETLAPTLEEYTFGVNTYYTDSDRDGPRSAAMYALLKEYNISSVPMVIVVRSGEILRAWGDPVTGIDEIKEYVRSHALP